VTGLLQINEQGEVLSGAMGQEPAFSGITLRAGEDAIIRIYHADRDAKDSVFAISLFGIEPKVVNTQIADSDGVQVAYDPSDPMHAAPLGVSRTMRVDNKKSYIVIATIYGATIVVVAVGVVIMARYLLRRRQV